MLSGIYLLNSALVMGPRARMFNLVFGEAQQILRKTFGLELVELMTRVERDQATSLDDAKGKKKGIFLDDHGLNICG